MSTNIKSFSVIHNEDFRIKRTQSSVKGYYQTIAILEKETGKAFLEARFYLKGQNVTCYLWYRQNNDSHTIGCSKSTDYRQSFMDALEDIGVVFDSRVIHQLEDICLDLLKHLGLASSTAQVYDIKDYIIFKTHA